MIVRQPLVLVEQTAGFDILVNVAGVNLARRALYVTELPVL